MEVIFIRLNFYLVILLNFSIMDGRRQNSRYNGRGTAAGQFPRSSRTRDSERAFSHQQNQAFSNNWAEAQPIDEYVPRPNQPRSTQRSQNWRGRERQPGRNKNQPRQQEQQQRGEITAVRESAPSNEPMYDIGPHSAGVAINELYQQNYDYAGYLSTCQVTYETLQGIDPRLSRRMPLSGFLHVMNTYLQTRIIDAVEENQERPIPGVTERAQNILPEDTIIPGPIYEYLSNIGTIVSPDGDQVPVNLPEIAIPLPEDELIPSGTFGPVNDQTHNVYECYLSPYTTMHRVMASALDQVPHDWDPLPPDLMPDGLVPTEDVLGYGPLDVLNPEGKA